MTVPISGGAVRALLSSGTGELPEPLTQETEPLPDPHTMSSHELLMEIATNIRELRAVIEPLIADPAALLANMGPMANVFGSMLGLGRR